MLFKNLRDVDMIGSVPGRGLLMEGVDEEIALWVEGGGLDAGAGTRRAGGGGA